VRHIVEHIVACRRFSVCRRMSTQRTVRAAAFFIMVWCFVDSFSIVIGVREDFISVWSVFSYVFERLPLFYASSLQ
jgi:hypothetical protein